MRRIIHLECGCIVSDEGVWSCSSDHQRLVYAMNQVAIDRITDESKDSEKIEDTQGDAPEWTL